ncbi:alkaline phosphatase family protein, partial [bacterium]|nr:alkaline phosphatase family protein [candidate division CSSED10-310 bacterium]
MSGRPVVVIGLDGFDPVLARQWMMSGDLPHLRSLADSGAFIPLKSTLPPFTVPAWSSFLTGVDPGRHGMTDFTIRHPGTCDTNGNLSILGDYGVTFINSTFRKSPTVFRRLSDRGGRVCAMGFPTTYPPEPVNGILIAGFDSPLAVTADRSFCYPPGIWDELKSRVHPYTLAGIQELHTGRRWHLSAARRILDTIAQRTAIASYLMQKESWDLFAVVFGESDTASHHFWAAQDPGSPRHKAFTRTYGSALSGYLRSVYTALDVAVGELASRAGRLMIVSDHGSGGTGIHRVSLNRILAEAGLFRYLPGGALPVRQLARVLPFRFGQWLFRHAPGHWINHIEGRSRLRHAHLPACEAFSDESNTCPSVWIHDQRFPAGRSLTARDRESVRQHIIDALRSATHPETGDPVIDAVHRREDIYPDSSIPGIPDLIVEPA